MKKVFNLLLFISLFLLCSCSEETMETETMEPEPVTFTGNDVNVLSYNDKLSTFIEKPYVINEDFYNFITTDKEYIDNDKIVDNAIYVSNDGNGDGSINNPCSIYNAVNKVEPGQTIYLRGGNYDLTGTVNINKSGTKDNYITIRNYPNEHVCLSTSRDVTKTKEYVVMDIQRNVSYLKIEGLEIANITAKNSLGILLSEGGQSHIIIRNNSIHDMKTSITNMNDSSAGANAILLLGELDSSINNVLIYGNECYNNVTGWCETISVSGNCEGVYVVENYVHDNTNIGIDFYGNAGYCSSEELDQPRYCVAALNKVEDTFCEYADAAGLYVDGARDVLLTNNTIIHCQYGIEIGAEELSEGYLVKNVVVKNNLIRNNDTCGLRIGGYDAKECGYVTSTKIYNNTIVNSSNGSSGLITISKVDGIEFVNNLVYTSSNKPLVTGDMSRTYTKNLTFRNNYFNNEKVDKNEFKFGLYNESQKGLDAFNSLVKGDNITGKISIDKDCHVLSGVTINAGDNSLDCGLYDIELKNRINGGSIDIGAYEY